MITAILRLNRSSIFLKMDLTYLYFAVILMLMLVKTSGFKPTFPIAEGFRKL